MSETPLPNATPPVIDVEALVAPIPGDLPAGANPRDDPDPLSPYRRLKSLRDDARTAERRRLDDPSLSPPDWGSVVDGAADLLSAQAKDVEVAAWLTEGLLRNHEMAGLRDGLRLLREICERWWDTLHPPLATAEEVPDEERFEDRLFAVSGLDGGTSDGTLIGPLRLVALANSEQGEPLGLWHFERAQDLAGITDDAKRQERIDAGTVPMDRLEAFVLAGDARRYRRLADDIAGAREALAALEQTLEARCGHFAPPSGNVRSLLAKIDETLRRVAAPHLAVPEEPPAPGEADAGGTAAAGGGAAGGSGGGGGPIRTRDDAFRQLELVAEFFRRTEPHSPLSYALQQCVRWGRLPLPELLVELIPDESARAGLFRLTGIPAPTPRPAE